MAFTTAQFEPLTRLPMAEYIFGTTPGMQEARASLEEALHSDLPVLIQGECGTGKEVAARYLHLRSKRAAGPFVRVSCGALPGKLLDGEMFGRSYGDAADAFGGGSVEMAASGTLFLDEFADLDSPMRQRVLSEVTSQGATRKSKESDARVVCATSATFEGAALGSRGLEELTGAFAHRIRLLPLRERKPDLPRLCEYLLEKFAVGFGRPMPRLSQHVLDVLERWDWPGNIRELEKWMARIVIFGIEEAVGPEIAKHAGRLFAETRRHRFRVNSSRFRRARRQI